LAEAPPPLDNWLAFPCVNVIYKVLTRQDLLDVEGEETLSELIEKPLREDFVKLEA
jgi:hypothetical protein